MFTAAAQCVLMLLLLAVDGLGAESSGDKNCDLEAVSAASRERQCWESLLIVALLAVPGGTGSPINPIATF